MASDDARQQDSIQILTFKKSKTTSWSWGLISAITVVELSIIVSCFLVPTFCLYKVFMISLGNVCISSFKFHLKKLQKDEISRTLWQELSELMHHSYAEPEKFGLVHHLTLCYPWYNYLYNHYWCTCRRITPHPYNNTCLIMISKHTFHYNHM